MAVLGVAAGGALIGGLGAYAAFGASAVMTGIALGWSIGAMVGKKMFGPDEPDTDQSDTGRLDSLVVQSSAYGVFLPILYGTARIAGNVIWADEMKEYEQEEETGGGGKGSMFGGGGGGGGTETTYIYTVSFAVSICEGVIAGVRRIWLDGDLLTDRGKDEMDITRDMDQFQGALWGARHFLDETISEFGIRVYNGTENQEPDPLIESIEGEGNVPGYRGTAYIVFENMKLTKYGNRIPNVEVEVASGLSEEPVYFTVPAYTDWLNRHQVTSAHRLAYANNDYGAWLKAIGEDGNVVRTTSGEFGYAASFSVPKSSRYASIAADYLLDEFCTFIGEGPGAFDSYKKADNQGNHYVGNPFTGQWHVLDYNPYASYAVTDGEEEINDFLMYQMNEAAYGADMIPNYAIARGFGQGAWWFLSIHDTDPPGLEDASFKDIPGWRENADNRYSKRFDYLVDLIDYFEREKSLEQSYEIGFEYNRKESAGADWYEHITFVLYPPYEPANRFYTFRVPEQEHTYYLYDLWRNNMGGTVGWLSSLRALIWIYANDTSHIYSGDWRREYYLNFADFDAVHLGVFNPANFHRIPLESVADDYYLNPPPFVKIWDDKIYIAYADNYSILYEYEHVSDIATDAYGNSTSFPSRISGAASSENPGNYSRKSDISTTVGERHEQALHENNIVFTDVERTGDFIAMVRTYDGEPHTCYILDGMGPEIITMYTYTTDSSGNERLDRIVGHIFEREGLSPSEYDVSELENDYVIGDVITRQSNGKQCLEPLMKAFQFDVTEYGGQIVCRKRGSDVVDTIPIEDLAVTEGGAEDFPEELSVTRSLEREIPKELSVKYMDIDLDYQVNVQRKQRQQTSSNNKKTLELPLVLNANQAMNIVESIFNAMWYHQHSYSFTTSVDHIEKVPGDVVDVKGHRILLQGINLKFPSILEFSGLRDDIAAYTTEEKGELPEFTSQEVGFPPMSFAIFLELPYLEFSGDTNSAGFYMAVYSYTKKGWDGARLNRSLDGGSTWSHISSTLSMATIGRANNVLSSGPVTRWDGKNSLNVEILTPERGLESKDKVSVLSGANTIAVGKDGKWEILSFVDAVQEDDGTFTLSNLLRGRRGTEHNISNHERDENVVLIQKDRFSWVPVPNEHIGNTVHYSLKTLGGNQSTRKIFTCEGRNLKPYSPAHVTGTRNVDGDLIVRWWRRTRIPSSWTAYEVPLVEESEKYDLEILDSEKNVIRTKTVTNDDIDKEAKRWYPSVESISRFGVEYPSGEQVEDFGSLQDSINVRVFQKNNIVGRGFSTEEVL